MVSQEAARIRAGFGDKRADLGKSPEVERLEWDAAADTEVVPDGVAVRAGDGRRGLWVEQTDGVAHGVLVWAHGGGFTSGSAKTHRGFGAQLALATSRRVWLSDYKLAPEQPCPAATEDVVGDVRWLLENGVPAGQIAIGGDSSGGALVLAALVALREQRAAMPSAGVLISAWLDLTLSGESMHARDDVDPLVSYEGLSIAARHYLGGIDASDSRASPLFADLRGLPPLLILVGEDEVLFDDARRLTERAVDAQLVVGEGMWHVWPMFAPDLPEAVDALAIIAEFLGQHLRA
jgi:acetyl esterase/lipase